MKWAWSYRFKYLPCLLSALAVLSAATGHARLFEPSRHACLGILSSGLKKWVTQQYRGPILFHLSSNPAGMELIAVGPDPESPSSKAHLCLFDSQTQQEIWTSADFDPVRVTALSLRPETSQVLVARLASDHGGSELLILSPAGTGRATARTLEISSAPIVDVEFVPERKTVLVLTANGLSHINDQNGWGVALLGNVEDRLQRIVSVHPERVVVETRYGLRVPLRF